MKSYRTSPRRVCTSAVLVRAAGRQLFPLMLLVVPGFAAFPNGYSYCKVVTTSHAMVSGVSDLTNYPLTVSLTDSDLKAVSSGGLVNNSNGYDIGFGPDCSGSGAMLQWEMESYTPTAGAIVAHVLRPTLSHTADDTVGMYYGGAFSSFQSTVSAVWDANYKGVWHLGNGLTPILTDSTSNANNGTGYSVSAISGKIDGGVALSGSDSSYLNMGNAGSLAPGSSLTISLWIKTSMSGVGFIAGMWNDATDAGQRYLLYMNGGKVNGVANATNGNDNTILGTTTINDGNWHYVAQTVTNGTNAQIIYVDGVADETATPTGTLFATSGSANNLLVGRSTTTDGSDFNGSVDELRISTGITRSPDWILTEYRNQSAPGTYITTGPRLSITSKVRHHVTGGM